MKEIKVKKFKLSDNVVYLRDKKDLEFVARVLRKPLCLAEGINDSYDMNFVVDGGTMYAFVISRKLF